MGKEGWGVEDKNGGLGGVMGNKGREMGQGLGTVVAFAACLD